MLFISIATSRDSLSSRFKGIHFRRRRRQKINEYIKAKLTNRILCDQLIEWINALIEKSCSKNIAKRTFHIHVVFSDFLRIVLPSFCPPFKWIIFRTQKKAHAHTDHFLQIKMQWNVRRLFWLTFATNHFARGRIGYTLTPLWLTKSISELVLICSLDPDQSGLCVVNILNMCFERNLTIATLRAESLW